MTPTDISTPVPGTAEPDTLGEVAASGRRATTRRAAKPDTALVEAVEAARAGLVAAVGGAAVGAHLGYEVEGERVVTHAFEARLAGYRGWRWAVTVARASRAKAVTVDESALLPGPESILAPEWLPWNERVQPGDLGAGDLLPAAADDPRLVPGWTAADGGPPTADDVLAVVEELGLGRERVLSVDGRDVAAERWYDGSGGPGSEVAQQAPAHCATCGFAVQLRGPLGQEFAVCANEHSPRDGAVVAADFGCGAHSSVPAPEVSGAVGGPVMDTLAHDAFASDAAVPDEPALDEPAPDEPAPDEAAADADADRR